MQRFCLVGDRGYQDLYDVLGELDNEFELLDHLNGFDSSMYNEVLDAINTQAKRTNRTFRVWCTFPVASDLNDRYSNILFKYKLPKYMYSAFDNYKNTVTHDFENFVCTFNGAEHVGRKFLLAILHKFGWFNPEYCTKNFAFTRESLDGAIMEIAGAHERFYNKFFMTSSSDKFFESIHTFGYERHHHNENIYNLENKLSRSFLHLVSETIPTSYYPFISEKVFYSVVTKGLFVAYAQPRWHQHLTQTLGFRNFNKIFDYKFDSIQNPIERLIELVSMLSKFSHLSKSEWHDLWLMENETIEFNYDNYFSGNYRKNIDLIETI